MLGIKAALNDDDAMVTSYRDHAHILACGTNPKYVMAEFFGKETGVSRGKGGSMHFLIFRKKLLWWTWYCWRSSSNWCGCWFCFQIQKRK